MSPWLIIGLVVVGFGLLVIFASLGVASDAERQSQNMERKIEEDKDAKQDR